MLCLIFRRHEFEKDNEQDSNLRVVNKNGVIKVKVFFFLNKTKSKQNKITGKEEQQTFILTGYVGREKHKGNEKGRQEQKDGHEKERQQKKTEHQKIFYLNQKGLHLQFGLGIRKRTGRENKNVGYGSKETQDKGDWGKGDRSDNIKRFLCSYRPL